MSMTKRILFKDEQLVPQALQIVRPTDCCLTVQGINKIWILVAVTKIINLHAILARSTYRLTSGVAHAPPLVTHHHP